MVVKVHVLYHGMTDNVTDFSTALVLYVEQLDEERKQIGESPRTRSQKSLGK